MTWQATRMLRPDIDDATAFVRRFVELDANGRVWKDAVGLRTVHVPRGASPSGLSAVDGVGADATVRDMQDLPGVIGRLE